MSKRAAAKNVVEQVVAAIEWVVGAIPDQPDGHPYVLVVDDEDQLQYESEHSDGAETMVVANVQENDEWKVLAVTYGNRDTYREDLGEYPMRQMAKKAMERWMARNPSGIQPEGQLF